MEDSDGEFMLIEAADHLPGWATPEKCANKLYIMNGQLHMIQRPEDITMGEAVAMLRQSPTAHRVSHPVEVCVQERIKGYPDEGVPAHQHRANAYVPVNVARLLTENPNWVAASVHAFCNRDPIDLKTIRAMKYFPPEHRVYTPVRFTKCLYAMLLHQQYLPDRRTGWQLPAKLHPDYKEAVLGMRLACGFEILVAGAQKKGQLEFDESDKQWSVFIKSLTSKGYFKGLLEGSQEYGQLKEAAKDYFLQHESNDSKWTTEVGVEILKQLREIDSSEEHHFPADKSMLPESESDEWLNVDACDLDRMMKERYKCNLEDIELQDEDQGENLAKQLEEFLKMKSDYEGVEEKNKRSGGPTVEANASSSAIDFDPDLFQSQVKNLLNFVIPEDNWHSEDSGDMSDYDGEEEAERNNIDEDMTQGKMKLYMDMMDKELKGTTVGKSFVAQPAKKEQNTENGEAAGGEFDDIEEFKPVDIEMNTVKNMLESYQSQLGGPGPTSNLLSSMGFNVKRLERKDEEPEMTEGTTV